MGAKVQIKNDSIHNFGGFYFCIDHFRKTGLANIIDNALGIRSVFATYSYSEIVETLMSIYLTGGTRIEDAKRLSNQFSEKTQGYELCSPDTVLKMLSDQASEDTFVDTPEGKSYRFNINGRLDKLLVDGLLKCGQVKAGGTHTFDYDNQFIPTEKYDSKYSYKKAFGYFPGIAQVDGMPFYIEGRDGNANVKLGQSETLRRAFEAAEARGVKVRQGTNGLRLIRQRHRGCCQPALQNILHQGIDVRHTARPHPRHTGAGMGVGGDKLPEVLARKAPVRGLLPEERVQPCGAEDALRRTDRHP